jgi:hypothetical protein
VDGADADVLHDEVENPTGRTSSSGPEDAGSTGVAHGRRKMADRTRTLRLSDSRTPERRSARSIFRLTAIPT